MFPAHSLRGVCLASCSVALWNQVAFQVRKITVRPLSVGSSPLWRLTPHLWPLIFDLSIHKVQCPAFWVQAGSCLLQATQAQPGMLTTEGPGKPPQQGKSLEYLSNANKLCTVRTCQNKRSSLHSSGPVSLHPPTNSDLSSSYEVMKQEKQSALLHSWSHPEPDSLASFWSL